MITGTGQGLGWKSPAERDNSEEALCQLLWTNGCRKRGLLADRHPRQLEGREERFTCPRMCLPCFPTTTLLAHSVALPQPKDPLLTAHPGMPGARPRQPFQSESTLPGKGPLPWPPPGSSSRFSTAAQQADGRVRLDRQGRL